MEKNSNQTTESGILTNRELQSAWEFVEHTGRSIFLTGKAGTGKTTFLKKVVEQSKKRLIVVAPTGVVDISQKAISVLCPGDSKAIEVEPLEWENTQYQLNPESREIESKVLGKFRQLPLRLAWAITINRIIFVKIERFC